MIQVSPIDVLETVFSCKISDEDLAKSRAQEKLFSKYVPLCPRTGRPGTFSSYNTDVRITTFHLAKLFYSDVIGALLGGHSGHICLPKVGAATTCPVSG
jgi:hypothetical protein